jgi:tetratricopeptide (TPR) repeat protein
MTRLPGATLLCGAGISVPSELPDGQRIARVAFDLVWRGAKAFDPDARDRVRAALDWSSSREPALRLELMLELLGRELDPAALVTVFRLLATAKPSRNHAALALSGASSIVTTNQDLLIEEAARGLNVRCAVQHLHGRYDRPGSIITFLSQYVEGLPLSTTRAFTKAVKGQRVVVVGYSGRDRDVMPLLSTADSVLWVHHRSPGRGQRPLAMEVEVLRSQLGARFEVKALDTAAFLLADLPAASRWRAQRFPARQRTTLSIPSETQRAYGGMAPLAREHGVARVLIHVGGADVALQGVKAARRLHGDSTEGRLLEADALLELNLHSEAIALYREAGRQAKDPATRCSALQSEAHALANTSEYAAAQNVLDEAHGAMRRVPEERTRLQLQGRIASLRGRMKGMTDDEPGAMRDYAHARRAFSRARDLDGYVEAMTFGSDMLRSRGRYREALQQIEEIFADTELYTRPYARGWARFYRGWIIGAMGDVAAGLADLDQATAVAEASGNHQGVAWGKLVIATYRRPNDLPGAERALDRCEAAIAVHGGPMFQCRARLVWERAEMGRARGNEAEARSQLSELEALLESAASPGPLPYMDAHVLALKGELARDLGDRSAEMRLRNAAAAYRRGKWAACVARIEVALWLLRGGPPPKRLLVKCRREGYGHELARLEGRSSGPYYPLHTL